MFKGSKRKAAKAKLVANNPMVSKILGTSGTSTFTPAAVRSGPPGCGPLCSNETSASATVVSSAQAAEPQGLLSELTQLLMQNRVPILA